MLRPLLASLVLLAPLPAAALETSAGDVAVTAVVTGLNAPWAVGFLPDGGILITEREGRLWHRTAGGDMIEVSGVPAVAAAGQGGLLDVLVPDDFATSRELFFSAAVSQRRGEGTALIRARLTDDGRSLSDVETIFELEPGSSGGRHFGSRIVEGRDGFLYMTIGDRGDRPSAQDLGNENGTVVRVARDGSVPSDNPFVGQAGIQPEIWSYGHRNPQGAALDLNGNLWVVEHGARGGDEVNAVQRGANFGWPVIAYGRHYSGFAIGEGTEKDGMEQPAFYWDPSMAPSGMMIYSGALWPEWEGDMFIGSLKFDYIARLDGDTVQEVEQITGSETSRVRDVREAPDGSIWFLSVGDGALYRMAPGTS